MFHILAKYLWTVFVNNLVLFFSIGWYDVIITTLLDDYIKDVLYLNQNKIVWNESYLEMNSPSSLEKTHLELKYMFFTKHFTKHRLQTPQGSSTFMGIYFSIWCLHLESSITCMKINALSPCAVERDLFWWQNSHLKYSK